LEGDVDESGIKGGIDEVAGGSIGGDCSGVDGAGIRIMFSNPYE
jgi:hypothetical protein